MSLRQFRTKFEEWWNGLLLHQGDTRVNSASSMKIMHLTGNSSGGGDANETNGDSLHRWWESLRTPSNSSADIGDEDQKGAGGAQNTNSPRKIRRKLDSNGSARRRISSDGNETSAQTNATSMKCLYVHEKQQQPLGFSTSEEDTCSTIVYDQRKCCGCRKRRRNAFHLSEEITLLLRHQ